MFFDLTDEQKAIKKAARDMLEIECPRSYVRAMMDDARGYQPELWKKMADLGWMGLALPERYGGAGLEFLSLTGLIEEMGRFLLPGPFVSTVVGGGLTLAAAGSPVQQESILPKLVRGDLLMTLAVGTDHGRLDAGGVQNSAVRQGDGFVLNGIVRLVPDAQTADIILLAARTSQQHEEGLTLFLVDAKAPGLSVHPQYTTDGRKVANLEFSSVRVPSTAVVGRVDGAWPIIAAAQRRLTLSLCAEAVGGAGMAMEISVEYAKTRVAFGRPIGMFQAIKHKCANMLVQVESGRFLLYYAAWLLQEGASEAPEAVAVAKAWCGDSYTKVASDGIQVHGGIGMTWEHDMHLFLKRAKVIELSSGDSDYHAEHIAKELERRATAISSAR
ncbi:MAG: acyl-CoA dehydrogenase [Dehalococcoidia bacterium]|nr:acyl-CoA dehydrogenase [Dehalococcoidia bacterium]